MLEYSQITGIGGRKENEDFASAKNLANGICAVLSDGLGSYGGGRIASETAVKTVLEYYTQGTFSNDESLMEICRRANDRILQMQTPSCTMKSTLAALFIEGKLARWMHIGDSRIYHFAGNEGWTRTRDHSVSQLAVMMGEIREDEIRFHADRNKVLRALGEEDGARAELSPPIELGEGFHAFLLCSDGFWEYVLETEMELDLCCASTPEQWLRFMENRLKKKVDGTNDNYTAAAVFAVI